MLKRCSLIAGLILTMGVIYVCPAWAIDQSRMEIHPMMDLGDSNQPAEVKDLLTFYIRDYDQTGPLAQWESIPGGDALQLAAQNYALVTDDYDVSLQDVVDSGLWPYDTFSPETNMQDRLYGFASFHCGFWDPELNQPLGPEVGSPEWWAHARAEILDMFYMDYYFTITDIEHVRTAEVGPRYAAFWTNPQTGLPMVESEEFGEYWLCPLSWMTGSDQCNNQLSADQLSNVDQIFAALQSAHFEFDGEGEATLNLATLGVNLSGIITLYNYDESHLRSREMAEDLARNAALKQMRAAGKLDFDFSIPRIRSWR